MAGNPMGGGSTAAAKKAGNGGPKILTPQEINAKPPDLRLASEKNGIDSPVQGPGSENNPYLLASGAYGNALDAASSATNMAAQMPTMTAVAQQASAQGYDPRDATSQGYDPASANAQGYNPAAARAQGYDPAAARAQQANAQGYDPASANAQGYAGFTGMGADGSPMAGFGAGNAIGYGYTAEEMEPARDVNARQFAGLNINPYMNPYTNQVVDQTTADMNRARTMQQEQLDAGAMQAGAFGGSRHGVASAETNRNFYDRLGATTGNLRNQGYQNAQQAAFQDIGNTLQADLANQGADLTTMQINAEAENQARRTGANNSMQASIANANAQTQLAGQRMGAVNNASQFGAAAQNRASLTNAAAQNTAGQFGAAAQNNASQFNASAQNQAALANAAARNQAGQFGAAAQNQAALANAAAQNQAGQFGAAAQNQAALANAAAQNQAAQFGARESNDTSRFNASVFNNARQFGAAAQNNVSQFNAGQSNQMNQFNAGAINQGEQARFNNLMQGAQTFSGLADQGFGFGQDITRQQMAQGALTRQMNQQLIDAGRQQYGNYTNAGNLGLSPLAQFAGGNYGGTSTQSSNPGLLGTIGAGVQLASAFCWVAREVYGQSNPEWLDFREWMLTKAPAWLRKAYIKHGPKWAEWVKRNPWSKRVLRPVMDWLKG